MASDDICPYKRTVRTSDGVFEADISITACGEGESRAIFFDLALDTLKKTGRGIGISVNKGRFVDLDSMELCATDDDIPAILEFARAIVDGADDCYLGKGQGDAPL